MTGILRIGVLGCAAIAGRSVIPAIKSISELDLVAVASRTREKAEEFASRFECEPVVGYENIINRSDIDALYIPLPTGLHEEWVTAALQNRKHVLTEKSLAMNLDSAGRMISAARENDLVLMEDFMYRHHSQHSFVWDQLKNGSIGELRLFKSSFGFPPLDKANFRYKKDLGGGAILDSAAYTVDASRWFLGDDLEVGVSNLFLDRSEKVCIHGSATLYSQRTGLSAQLSFGFDNFYQCNYELWGAEGLIFCERAFTPPSAFRPKVTVKLATAVTDHILEPDNHFIHILRHFVATIRQKNAKSQYEGIYHQSRLLTDIEEKAKIHYI